MILKYIITWYKDNLISLNFNHAKTGSHRLNIDTVDLKSFQKYLKKNQTYNGKTKPGRRQSTFGLHSNSSVSKVNCVYSDQPRARGKGSGWGASRLLCINWHIDFLEPEIWVHMLFDIFVKYIAVELFWTQRVKILTDFLWILFEHRTRCNKDALSKCSCFVVYISFG